MARASILFPSGSGEQHYKMLLILPKIFTERCDEHWEFCFPHIKEEKQEEKTKTLFEKNGGETVKPAYWVIFSEKLCFYKALDV